MVVLLSEEGFEPAGRRNETQSVSEVAEEDGIVDIEQDDDNDGLLDEEFLNKLIHSRDFFGLVDAYTGTTDGVKLKRDNADRIMQGIGRL